MFSLHQFASKKWGGQASRSKKVQIFEKSIYTYCQLVTWHAPLNRCSSNQHNIIKIKVKNECNFKNIFKNISAWVFFCNLAANFQNSFLEEYFWGSFQVSCSWSSHYLIIVLYNSSLQITSHWGDFQKQSWGSLWKICFSNHTVNL